jgi:hypothetical protein
MGINPPQGIFRLIVRDPHMPRPELAGPAQAYVPLAVLVRGSNAYRPFQCLNWVDQQKAWTYLSLERRSPMDRWACISSSSFAAKSKIALLKSMSFVNS